MKAGKTLLRCVAETDNEFDENAVRIEALLDEGWTKIGFIAKGSNADIHKHLLSGGSVDIKCKEVTGLDKDTMGVNVSVEYGDNDSVDLDGLIRQRVVYGDEPFIYFDEAAHRAYDSRSRELVSGSMMEDKYHPVGDLTYAAKALAKKTGCKREDIQAAWEAKGELAQLYGTALHRAIELRLLHMDTMNSLDEAQKRDQSAVNWMPAVLSDAVIKLENLLLHDKKLNPDWLQSEARIKYGNLTGIADLVWMDNDGYFRLYDFKTNQEIKKVKYTEFGIMPKYTVQQNHYRTILEALGYKCLGMSLLHWHDGKWTEIPLERVNLDKEILWSK